MYYIATDNGTVHTLPFLRPSHGTVTDTVRRERGPEGWLQGNKVTDDDPVWKKGRKVEVYEAAMECDTVYTTVP